MPKYMYMKIAFGQTQQTKKEPKKKPKIDEGKSWNVDPFQTEDIEEEIIEYFMPNEKSVKMCNYSLIRITSFPDLICTGSDFYD